VNLDGVVGLCGVFVRCGEKNQLLLVWFALVLSFVCLIRFGCPLCQPDSASLLRHALRLVACSRAWPTSSVSTKYRVERSFCCSAVRFDVIGKANLDFEISSSEL
jgi:hypothetical protein